MTDSISRDPYDRFGPYKSLGDVPPCLRLESYRQWYEGLYSWGRFMARELIPQHDSHLTKQRARLAGRRWKDHMASTSRHDTLARPTHVETWCVALLEDVTLDTAYRPYWSMLERFYELLHWRPDHPHRYSTVLMAAAEYEHASQIWQTKMDARYP